MRKILALFLFLCSNTCPAQTVNQFGLSIINTPSDYQRSILLDSNNTLLEISKFIPGIKLDIRYAGTNNFSGKAVYDQARAFARAPVVKALESVQHDLNKRGLGLKIYDGYRPYSVTVKFFEIASDKNFVANPQKGSRHNRGCAIDLTLVKLRNGKEIKMPTTYDSFAPEASSNFKDLPRRVIRKRDLLIAVMTQYGFSVLDNEWWHFDFKDWKQYDLMDIPFKDL